MSVEKREENDDWRKLQMVISHWKWTLIYQILFNAQLFVVEEIKIANVHPAIIISCFFLILYSRNRNPCLCKLMFKSFFLSLTHTQKNLHNYKHTHRMHTNTHTRNICAHSQKHIQIQTNRLDNYRYTRHVDT